MSLSLGTRLGVYEVTAKIGEGGIWRSVSAKTLLSGQALVRKRCNRRLHELQGKSLKGSVVIALCLAGTRAELEFGLGECPIDRRLQVFGKPWGILHLGRSEAEFPQF